MGKRLDKAAFLVFFFLSMFVLLLFTGKDIRIVSVLSAISALCMGVILKSVKNTVKPDSFRRKKKSRAKQVKSLIYKENTDALSETIALLQKKYNLHSVTFESGRMYFKEGSSEELYEVYIIRKYKASPDDILSVWRESKKIRPIKGILFLIPGKMDQDVKLLRYKINNPGIIILDSNALKALYRKHAQSTDENISEKRITLFHFLRYAVNRKRAFRYLAYALLLTGYYLFSGNLLYLFFGAILTSVCLFSFFSNVNSDRLFS